MNNTLLSLCVFGAGLATANILIMQRPTCPSPEVAAAPSTKTEAASAVQGKPVQAAKAAASKPTPAPKNEDVSTAQGKTVEARAQAKPPHAPKLALKPPAPAPKAADVTGTVKQAAKPEKPGEKPAPAEHARSANVEGEPEEWAEVSLAARAHKAPSVSSPTVRSYHMGTKLKVTGRESGWIKVVDPTTLMEGWIYEKYLTPTEGPDQKKSAQADPNPANLATPAPPPGRYARSYKSRKYGWKRYRYPGPPIGFAIGVYPRW